VDDYLRTKVSLELDSSDNAQLCYQKDFNLIYAQNKVDNWDYDTVDNSQDTGFNCSLALDSDDYPHISYFDRGNSTFMYASLIEDSWFIESVAEESNPLSSRPDTVLQLDSAGNPHIATSTMVFLRNVLRILSGGELYVPRWLYLPNIFR
jgi:hypothetical protein